MNEQYNKDLLLDVRHLNIQFKMNNEILPICSDISFSIKPRERIGLIGESGCGKTLIALSILQLLPDNAETSGFIGFDNRNLVSCNHEEIRFIRGKDISMIFEQPKTCLNPVFSIGWQIKEAVKRNSDNNTDSLRRVKEILKSVGMDPNSYSLFPHQLSGGMQQRVMIAIAMASNPKLLIADEPTTALDLIHQAQLLDLIKAKTSESGCSLFVITHDLDVAAELCDKVLVMYAGEIVEISDIMAFLEKPLHPYSCALVQAITDTGFFPIPGMVADFSNLPSGCHFSPRCIRAETICSSISPELRKISSGYVRCHFA